MRVGHIGVGVPAFCVTIEVEDSHSSLSDTMLEYAAYRESPSAFSGEWGPLQPQWREY